MTTATAPAPKSAKKTAAKSRPDDLVQPSLPFMTEPETPVEAESQVNLADLREMLTQEYVEVQMKINWLSTSAQIADVLRQKMVNPVKASRNAVRLSKALFSADHPAVKKANAAKNALVALRDAYSHAMPELPVAGATFKSAKDAKDKAEDLMKRGGCRLMPLSQVDEFYSQCQVLIDNLYRAANEMDKQLESIKAADKAELQDLYDEHDYPTSVRELIKVRGPSFRQIGLSVNFAESCPKAFAQLQKQISDEYVDCFKLATADFAETLVDLTETVTRQLGNRRRLRPLKSHPLTKELDGAEVLEVGTHKDYPEDVSNGQVMVQVRLSKEGREHYLARTKRETKDAQSATETVSKKNDPVWYGPFSEEDYTAQLRPYSTDEKRSLHDSSVTQLLAHIEHFKRVGDLFKAGGDANIAKAVAELEETLQLGAVGKDQLVKELRTSGMARATLSSALRRVVDEVKEKAVVTTKVRKVRRITTAATLGEDE